MSLTEEARKAYKDMVSALEQEQAEEALKNDKKAPHQMGHYRNHSAASAISFCSILSEPISEVNEKEYGKHSPPIFPAYTLCVNVLKPHSTSSVSDNTIKEHNKSNIPLRDQLEEYG